MGKRVGSGYPPAKDVIRGSPARARNSRIAEGCTRSARRANVAIANLLISTVDGIERRSVDGVGVQPMVSVHAVDVARLSEWRDDSAEGQAPGTPVAQRREVLVVVHDVEERGTVEHPGLEPLLPGLDRLRP